MSVNKYNSTTGNLERRDGYIVDSTPTQNSGNPVSSGGVYTALDGKLDTGINYASSITLTGCHFGNNSQIAIKHGNLVVVNLSIILDSETNGIKFPDEIIPTKNIMLSGWISRQSYFSYLYGKQEAAQYQGRPVMGYNYHNYGNQNDEVNIFGVYEIL